MSDAERIARWFLARDPARSEMFSHQPRFFTRDPVYGHDPANSVIVYCAEAQAGRRTFLFEYAASESSVEQICSVPVYPHQWRSTKR